MEPSVAPEGTPCDVVADKRGVLGVDNPRVDDAARGHECGRSESRPAAEDSGAAVHITADRQAGGSRAAAEHDPLPGRVPVDAEIRNPQVEPCGGAELQHACSGVRAGQAGASCGGGGLARQA